MGTLLDTRDVGRRAGLSLCCQNLFPLGSQFILLSSADCVSSSSRDAHPPWQQPAAVMSHSSELTTGRWHGGGLLLLKRKLFLETKQMNRNHVEA